MLKNINIKYFGFVLVTLFVVGCATTVPIQSISNDTLRSSGMNLSEPIDITIFELNPGIFGKPQNYEKNGIWPELRRAEARRFSKKIKDSLDSSNAFGSVNITPLRSQISDVVISGKIIKSNGEDLHLEISAKDSTGTFLIQNKIYKHRTNEYFFRNLRNKDKDPFDDVFNKIAFDLIKALSKSNLSDIKLISELKFASQLEPREFSDALTKDRNGRIKTNFIPASDDPTFLRTKNLRSLDIKFTDNMQPTYINFLSNMEDSYKIWQKASFEASKKQREAEAAAVGQAILGAVILAASVAAAADSGDGYDFDSSQYAAGVTGAIVGVGLLGSAIGNAEEAKTHSEAFKEVSESFDNEIAPKVIELEGKNLKLEGSLKQQFSQWKSYLREIYDIENQEINDIIIL